MIQNARITEMQIHHLKPNNRGRSRRRVGRGGKRGTTSGRGTKGQKARAGAKIRPAIRDIMKKFPKQRGYRFRSFRPKPAVVDLERIAGRFPPGATVDPAALLGAGLVHKKKGRTPAIKVLGSGAIQKKMHFRGVDFSASARSRIQEAGGTIG